VDDHQEEPVNLNKYAAKIHETAASHGFWPEDDKQQVVDAFNRICLDVIDGSSSESGGDIELVRNFIQAHEVRNMGEMLMLATSELAEALEEHRDGNPVHYYSYIHSPALSGTGLDFSVMGPDELDRLSIKKKPEGLAVEPRVQARSVPQRRGLAARERAAEQAGQQGGESTQGWPAVRSPAPRLRRVVGATVARWTGWRGVAFLGVLHAG
jgi:hypothetical protein